MGRQALIATLCWLIQETLAVNLVLNNNNLSADNVKRLYRHEATPYGMYKYATSPYGAYTYQVPYVMSPKPLTQTRPAAVSNTKIVQDTSNIYLKDSYGNKYVPSPHSIPLKPLTPQQFLQLQALPSHLVQPLAATPFTFNYKQAPGTQQIVYGSQYKLPQQQTTPGTHYVYEQAHPSGNTQAIKSLPEYTPSSFQTYFGGSLYQYPPQHSSTLTYEHPTPTFASYPESEESVSAAAVQQQSTSNNKHVFSISSTISPPSLRYTTPKPKFLPESEEIYDEEKREAVRSVKSKLKKNNANVASVKTVVNGKKAVVNIETKPTLPLLDISLLEPLTFDNPILPQVQHYLPRIHDANYVKLSEVKPKQNKYQKEFVIQKTKHYGSGYVKSKPKKTTPKKKIPSVEIITFDEIAQASTARPVIATEEAPQQKPEISYEINSPGYKETYKEKAVSYNKETNSEPVHYTYGSHKHEEPTHYTYTHSSKEPLHVKTIHYEGHGEGPKGNKPVEQNETSKPEDQSEESESSSEEDDTPHYHEKQNEHQEKQNEHQEKQHHSKPEHREEEYHHNSKLAQPVNEQQAYSQYFSEDGGFHPVAQYEEEIHVTSPENVEKEYNQHQHLAKQEQHKSQQNDQHQHHQVHYQHKPQHSGLNHQQQQQPQKEYHHKPQQQVHKEYHHQPQQKEHNYESVPHHKEQHQHRPLQIDHQVDDRQQHPRPPHHQAPYTHSHPVHVQEKTKKIFIKEETPVEDDSPKEKIEEHENSEQDFEKAYKNAAFGFPAYDSHANSPEKDIYNPENYGVPRQNSDYKAELSPFQQYSEKGDNFPTNTRLNYLDTRDKTKDNYFLDFSINHPEFMSDWYTKKVDYLKLYQKQKPENYLTNKNNGNKQAKQSENYAAIPYDFYPAKAQKPKLAYTEYAIPRQEFDYSKFKGEKKDNYAFASKPLYTYKLNTHFVEPQFQYGFEPVALPRLLDSELAAMATNVRSESEKPSMRKKIYKENFYIKKTTSNNGSNS